MVIFGVGNKNWLIAIQPAFERAPAVIFVWKKSSFRLDLAIKQTTPQPPYITQSFAHMHWTPAYTQQRAFYLLILWYVYMYAPFMNNAAAAV